MLLVNGAAGSVDERALGTVVATLGRYGPVTVRSTTGPGDVDDAIDDVGDRRLVAVGGDGSLHLAVNRLLARGMGHVPLALVALGTGNDLARGIGLPLDPAAGARVAAEGTPAPMPVLVHQGNTEVVVNNAHVGVGVRAAELATGLKPRLGALAYPAGGVAVGLRPRSFATAVHLDGATVFEGDAEAVVVVLGPSAGGGHRVAPDADPAEPQLEVLVITSTSLWHRVQVAAAVAVGRDPVDWSPAAQRFRGRAVEVRHLGATEATWDLDGEIRPWTSPVRLTVQPAAWHLVR